MPDALQPVSSRTDNDRRLLAALCPPVERCQIVGQDLKRVEKVIKILNLGNRPQPTQGHAHCLTDNGCLADTCIGDSEFAILELQSGASLVDATQQADILAKNDHARITPQHGIKGRVENLEARNLR